MTEFYEGTRVLRNKLGLKDAAALERAERRIAAYRACQLWDAMAQGHLAPVFDGAHVRAVHKALFRDIYDWAGEFRTVEIYKGSSGFMPPDEIEDELRMFCEAVEAIDFPSLSGDALVTALTAALRALNRIHPFREGNGRTQRLLVSELALRAGHMLSWAPFDENIMRNASVAAMRGDDRKMQLYIADGLSRRP